MPVLIRRVLPLAVVGLLLAPAVASPSTAFDQARTTFRAGQYSDSIALFGGLLYPKASISDPRELAEAHLLLAASYFETGRTSSAIREFDTAYNIEPDLSIETQGFSAGASDFFQKRKRELDRKAREVEQRMAAARAKQKVRDDAKNIRIPVHPNLLLNLVPFGVGQVQNGDDEKALFFGLTEGAFAVTSFGIWAYLKATYPDGKVPVKEVSEVHNLEFLEIGSGIVCFGVMGWGIVDAYANRETRLYRHLNKEEQEEYIKLNLPAENKPKTSLHIVPTVTPQGAGVGLAWEF